MNNLDKLDHMIRQLREDRIRQVTQSLFGWFVC